MPTWRLPMAHAGLTIDGEPRSKRSRVAWDCPAPRGLRRGGEFGLPRASLTTRADRAIKMTHGRCDDIGRASSRHTRLSRQPLELFVHHCRIADPAPQH